jgi:hypothetical protein
MNEGRLFQPAFFMNPGGMQFIAHSQNKSDGTRN